MTGTRGAVVLISGGMDSTVLLHHVVRNLGYGPIRAISYDYGQRHARELACAREQAALAGAAEYRTIDIAFVADLLRPGTTLVAGAEPVPDLGAIPEDRLTQPPTYVPNRNMMLLAMAAAYAEANGVYEVFYGAQAQDEYGYWDCTAAFLERLNHVLQLNRAQPVTVRAPFVAMGKADIVRLGMQLGVDFGRTWSCYRGGEVACGGCPTCVERLKAFKAAGCEDPLPYAEQD